MYLSSSRFFDDLAARIAGPMSARFFLQPAIAIALGIRDGLMDAKAGNPPFIYDVVFHPEDRPRDLRNAFKALLIPIVVATALDGIVQYMMFKHVRPGAAVLVGSFVMGVSYAYARGVIIRVATARRRMRVDK
jgi:hypothetical protein